MVAVGRRRIGIVTLIRGSGLGIRSLFGDGVGLGVSAWRSAGYG